MRKLGRTEWVGGGVFVGGGCMSAALTISDFHNNYVAGALLVIALGGGGIAFWHYFFGHEPQPPEPDTSVQNAMMYVVVGKWPSLGDTLSDEDSGGPCMDVLEKLREAAGAGKITVWGRQSRNHLMEEIPKEYWIYNQFDYMTAVFSNNPYDVAAEVRVPGTVSTMFYQLSMSSKQVEALWPSR